MGQRTTASGTVTLNDVPVDQSEMITSNREEGRTYYGAFTQLSHAAMDAGIAFAALDDAITLARTKARPVPESKVDRASEDPYAMHAVGEMGALARSGSAVCENAAAVVDTAAKAFLSGAVDEKILVEASIAVAEAKVIAAEVSMRASEMLYRVGGAVGASRSLNLDRHWRNARTHTLHDPVSYKYKAVGDYYLNGTYPPNNAKY
jgi:alkylation response protein AidB-like acyl-CoA dehydrogenase